MRFGLEVIPFGEFSNPRTVVEVAQVAEAAGWEGIWVWDHLVFPWPVGDPWVTLSAVATATSRLKLVTGVAPLPRYRPHLLARMLTALDVLSEGRVIFGTGLGIPSDYSPFGEPVDARVRAAMVDEGLSLLAQFWSGAEVSHHGQFYAAEWVRLLPEPVQRPRIPIWIGGDSKAALRRAAQWDGWIIGVIDEQGAITKPPHHLAGQVEYIREHRSDNAPFEVAIDGVSVAGDGDALVREYAAAGATWWFEAIHGSRGSLEELLARVKAGPPR
jgi:alkanesulfonate monooxygenase SsuD/methylene tetrahydromethanopterin reductase-like flavin-dependent oxidoreductase (luciferase family)